MKFLTSLILICIFLPILFVVVFSPEPCEHEDTILWYFFTSQDSVSNSDVCRYCKNCEKRISTYSQFTGTPIDQSYLEALKEHSDTSEFVPGEYYILTATVPLGYINGSSNKKAYINCEVENEEFKVRFTVDFKEEYEELVSQIQEDEVITFRGRYYNEGCGFTDAELIDVSEVEQ